jgi:hypothetical protein
MIADAVKRQHGSNRVIGDLLKAQIDEKQARSIKYQMTIAQGNYGVRLCRYANQRGVGAQSGDRRLSCQPTQCRAGRGTGAGKPILALRSGAHACAPALGSDITTPIDLMNRLEGETRAGKAERIAYHLSRLGLAILDELGYPPFALSCGQLLLQLVSRLDEQTSIMVSW